MDTAKIKEQCEAFLKQINVPGFVVIGLQTENNTQVVYSLKEMPLKGIVKGLTHILNDVMQRL